MAFLRLTSDDQTPLTPENTNAILDQKDSEWIEQAEAFGLGRTRNEICKSIHAMTMHALVVFPDGLQCVGGIVFTTTGLISAYYEESSAGSAVDWKKTVASINIKQLYDKLELNGYQSKEWVLQLAVNGLDSPPPIQAGNLPTPMDKILLPIPKKFTNKDDYSPCVVQERGTTANRIRPNSSGTATPSTTFSPSERWVRKLKDTGFPLFANIIRNNEKSAPARGDTPNKIIDEAMEFTKIWRYNYSDTGFFTMEDLADINNSRGNYRRDVYNKIGNWLFADNRRVEKLRVACAKVVRKETGKVGMKIVEHEYEQLKNSINE